jgi:ribosomal protein S18 acetylase RimI-like enzyme
MTTNTRAEFVVRRLRSDEINLVRAWASAEGWNPGLYDIGCFYGADTEGFFLGELYGEPVACISCVAYDDSFGFLGHYIVRPEFRGRGYGLEVWRAGMSHLGERNVGLDGVVAQQENYRKSGFRFVTHSHIRYRGVGGGEAAPGLVALRDVPFDELVAYDREHFPADRPEFLRCWVAPPGATSLGCVRGGRLVGYGVSRPADEGYKVGPLFANDPGVADAIFRGLLATAPGQPVFINAPDETVNPHIAELVQRYGLSETFRAARMYNKAVPQISLRQVYGVTSLELC